MNLKEYLKPLVSLYGTTTISKIIKRHPDTINKWYINGLPASETKGTTIYRAQLARLAKEHSSTKHITIRGLGRYINNANGD